MKNPITVTSTISASVDKVWEYWTNPQHIINWNFATDTWRCPTAKNNMRPNGKFSWRMEAKDGSMGFDFSGTYNKVEPKQLIELTLDDNRKVAIASSMENGVTTVTETFEPDENEVELQRIGWQAILDNFKKYVESN